MLTDVPAGVSAARLAQFVMLMRGFGRVIATVASGNRNFSSYQNIGLSSIALDLSIGSQDMTRLQADILQIAAAGRQLKMGAGLFGVRTGDTTGIAHAADIRLFHGPAIGPALNEPKRMSYKARDAVVPNSENAGEEEWF
jgi:hypothetical protein